MPASSSRTWWSASATTALRRGHDHAPRTGWTGYGVGDYIYVGGDTTNATTKGGYYQIGADQRHDRSRWCMSTRSTARATRCRAPTCWASRPTAASPSPIGLLDPLQRPAKARSRTSSCAQRDDVDVAVDGLVNAKAGRLDLSGLRTAGEGRQDRGGRPRGTDPARRAAPCDRQRASSGSGINFKGLDIVHRRRRRRHRRVTAMTVEMSGGRQPHCARRPRTSASRRRPPDHAHRLDLLALGQCLRSSPRIGSILDALGTDTEKVRANHISLTRPAASVPPPTRVEINVDRCL